MIYSASMVFFVLSPVEVVWERLLNEYWFLVCLNFYFEAEKAGIFKLLIFCYQFLTLRLPQY